MSFHTDYKQWLRLSEKENCPVCNQSPMPDGMVDIVEWPHSWLSAEPHECLKGACHITAKKHVVELFELEDEELSALMMEVKRYAKALQKVTQAVKINYEIHGNSLPHLHVHLYPRYMDDPFPGKAIDYSMKENMYAEGEFDRFVTAMRHELSGLLSGC